jgi:radical SAM superfamily enzyme YgiQ (UPF0313 family)
LIKSSNRNGPVVLVSEDIAYAFPFGIAYLAGYLRRQGENVQILFRPGSRTSFEPFAREIIGLKPLVVGFGGLYPDLHPVRDLTGLLKDSGCTFPIVIGGQMVSPTPEFAVRITGADMGVIGEGEIILHDLVKALRTGEDPSTVAGLAIREGDTVRLTGTGEYIHDLSELPPIPYDLFPTDKWLNFGRFYAGRAQPHWHFNDRVVSIHGGRGCPYTCNFCYHASKARYRKISDMIAEADAMLRRYDANMLSFGDDTALASPQRASELVETLSKLGRPVEYSVSSRFDILSRIDDTLLREMKRSGCRIMGLGIESGSQRVLDVMHKGTTVDQIVSGLRRLKEVGILPTVSIMVGQLSETLEDAEESMALMLDAVRHDKHIQFAFTITTPFPGTELYEIALERGILNDHYDFFQRFSPDRQWGDVTANLSEMTDDEVRCMRQKMEMAFIRESALMKGDAMMAVEFLRGKVADSYGFYRRMESRLGGLGGVLHRPSSVTYDLVQSILDRVRLRLMGLDT